MFIPGQAEEMIGNVPLKGSGGDPAENFLSRHDTVIEMILYLHESQLN